MLSFLGLAGTGCPLVFSDEPWARAIVAVLGSFEVAGWLHRVFASLLIAVFAMHLGRLGRRLLVHKDWGILWGPYSMVPQPRDLRDLIGHLRWFVGRGPRPASTDIPTGRSSTTGRCSGAWASWRLGLFLWFPVFFSRFLPGWIFNVALLIHGEEALLAVGFIFTMHFFNGHLRPEVPDGSGHLHGPRVAGRTRRAS